MEHLKNGFLEKRKKNMKAFVESGTSEHGVKGELNIKFAGKKTLILSKKRKAKQNIGVTRCNLKDLNKYPRRGQPKEKLLEEIGGLSSRLRGGKSSDRNLRPSL